MGFIVGIAAILFCFYLNHRITELEQLLRERSSPLAPTTAVPQATGVNELRPIPPVQPIPAPTPAEPSGVEQLFDWIRQDFLMKLGAGLLLLALGWFVSYAFANNWIGPVGRITLGLVVSSLVMIGGVWRLQRYPQQGSVLVCLGATGILMTLFAARELYEMFTPVVALGLSFLTAVFVAFVSVAHGRRSLAYAGLILGSIAPLLINMAQPDELMFFCYLLLVAAGTLWVVWQTGWTGLILTSLLITGGYSLTYLLDTAGDSSIAVLFSFLFVALYYVANIVSLVRRRQEGTHHMRIHAAIAGGTALFLFAWIQTAITTEWHSLLYVAWAMVFVLGAYVVYQFTANYAAFYVYGGTAVVLLAFATAAELDGASLVIAYTIQITALLVTLRQLLPIPQVLARTSILFALPIALSVELLAYRTWDSPFGIEFATLLILAATTGLVVWLFQTMAETEEDQYDVTVISAVLVTVAVGYAAILVWNVAHLLFADAGTVVALILYAIVGVGLLISSQSREQKFTKIIGACFIGFVVARLLLVEVWNMPIELRIITFVIIGVLLISTAFIGKTVMQQHGETT